MKSIHVVHPYVFKMEEFTPGFIRLGRGSSQINASRDAEISEFLKRGLEKGLRVVCHNMVTFDNSSQDHIIALSSDLRYEFLVKDARVQRITTTSYGRPIPDERPGQVHPQEWTRLQRIVSSLADFRRASGKSERTFFMGGAVEACLSGAIDIYLSYCSQPTEQVYVIGDFCIMHDLDAGYAAVEQMEKRGVHIIQPPEAYRLLEESL